jgi:hypothetical protein
MTKISALSDIGTSVASNDAFVLVDVSDPTTPNKKIQQQNLFLIPDGSAGTPAVRFLNDTDVGLFRPTTNTLALATGGSERLRIDSSGRVGIGTSSPLKKTEIRSAPTTADTDGLRVGDGTRYLEFAQTGATYNYMQVGSNQNLIYFSGSNLSLSTDGANAITLNTNSLERVRVTSAGNVGIGTTTPGLSGSNRTAVTINAPTGQLSILEFGVNNTLTGYLYSNASQTTLNSQNTPLTFEASGAERARIDSSGRLLVGTSTARGNFFNSTVSAGLQTEGTGEQSIVAAIRNTNTPAEVPVFLLARSRGTSVGSNTLVVSGDELGYLSFQGNDGSQFVEGARISAAVDGTSGADDLPTRLVFSTTEDGESSPRERMRISQDGKISIGLGDTINGPLQVYNGNSSQGVAFVASDGSGNEWHFGRGSGDGYFYVVRQTGTGMYMNTNSWVATSDQRAKQNIADIESTIDVVKALKPSRFNWKADGSADVGFIAQQVQPLIPEAVVDSGDPDAMLGITQDKLLPFVVKALQEAVAKIESLEARLTAAGV